MTTVILTLEDKVLYSGFIPVETIDDVLGRRMGKMPVTEVVQLLKNTAQMEMAARKVRIMSRFAHDDLLGVGNDGDKWVAVKAIPPAEYFLTTVTGQAFKVALPRLVARVTNMGSSYLFWTEAQEFTSQTLVYPLIIGNIRSDGWICLGTTRLHCKTLKDIDRFVRQVVEAPSTGTYVQSGTKVEEFYEALTRSWDKSVGAKHGITLEKLLASTE